MRLLHTTANGKPLTFVAANILSLTRRTSGGTWLDFIDGTAISVDDSCESLIAQLDDSPVAPPTVTPPTVTPDARSLDPAVLSLISRMCRALPLHVSGCYGGKCRERTCIACWAAEVVCKNIRDNNQLVGEALRWLEGVKP